jgi:predicted nucleic acid-binding protein
MSRRLLDTDILSEIIKGKNTAVAARATAYLAEQRRFTTSAVSVAEIVYGFRRMGRDDRVTQFEASMAVPRSFHSTMLRRASPGVSTQTLNVPAVLSACPTS